MSDNVLLVDQYGTTIGHEEKLRAHKLGLLHSAFSLQVVRPSIRGYEYLLQQRALEKYLSGGLWSNTCCSHPKENEALESAVLRRVYEELNVTTLPPLKALKPIIYKEHLDNGLIEYEFDHIFISIGSVKNIQPVREEVMSFEWLSEELIDRRLMSHPNKFTAWFKYIYSSTKNFLNKLE